MKTKIVIVFLLVMLLAIVLVPLAASTQSAGNQKVIVKLVFSRDITNSDIKSIEKIGGRVIYVFNEVRGLAVLIDKDKASSLYSLNGVAQAGFAFVREALSEMLPSNCAFHSTVLTWNLDMINVPTVHEVYGLDGSGV
jgi:hypothetical protein